MAGAPSPNVTAKRTICVRPDKPRDKTVGNIGLHFVCYRLTRHGWSVMPTARNARGIDVLACSQDEKGTVTVQVKSLSARNSVLLGSTLDGFIAQFMVVCHKVRTDFPSPSCLHRVRCLNGLSLELLLLKPLAVIALGQNARTALDEHRDLVLSVAVFTVPHPSFRNRGRIHELLPRAEHELRNAMSGLPTDIADSIAGRFTSRRSSAGGANPARIVRSRLMTPIRLIREDSPVCTDEPRPAGNSSGPSFVEFQIPIFSSHRKRSVGPGLRSQSFELAIVRLSPTYLWRADSRWRSG